MDGSATEAGGGSGRGGGDTRGQGLGRQRLQQLLELLAVVLEPEELAALVATSCQVSMQLCLCIMGLGIVILGQTSPTQVEDWWWRPPACLSANQ